MKNVIIESGGMSQEVLCGKEATQSWDINVKEED